MDKLHSFAKALAEHLRAETDRFTTLRDGPGGCETCGYGAEEWEVLDMDKLDKEIDAFVATFESVNK